MNMVFVVLRNTRWSFEGFENVRISLHNKVIKGTQTMLRVTYTFLALPACDVAPAILLFTLIFCFELFTCLDLPQ